MTEPVRIRDDGREPDRALLRAAPPLPPPGLQERLRRSIEARAAAPRSRRWRWWAAGLLGLLGTGTAFALGTSPGRDLLFRLVGATPEVIAPAGSSSAASVAPPAPPAPGPDWPPPPAPPPPATPARRLREAKLDPPAAPPVILQPGLRQPPGEWSMSGATGEPDRRPPPAPSLLRITYRGRTTALRATASTIEGHLRGAAVSLRFEGSRLTGKIGDQPIDLFLRHDQGGGTIAGEAIGFGLSPTDEGAIVRGWVPGHSVRVELGKAGLSFFPGCERGLFPQSAGPGIYKGECADGQMMQLTLPAAFEAMPLFPRLLALGLLLTERDPILQLQRPGLFPDPL